MRFFRRELLRVLPQSLPAALLLQPAGGHPHAEPGACQGGGAAAQGDRHPDRRLRPGGERVRVPGKRARGVLRLRAQELHAEDGARGGGVRAGVDLPGHRQAARGQDRPRAAPVRRGHDLLGQRAGQAGVHRKPGELHRGEPHHHRGLPDQQHADLSRA